MQKTFTHRIRDQKAQIWNLQWLKQTQVLLHIIIITHIQIRSSANRQRTSTNSVCRKLTIIQRGSSHFRRSLVSRRTHLVMSIGSHNQRKNMSRNTDFFKRIRISVSVIFVTNFAYVDSFTNSKVLDYSRVSDRQTFDER